MLLVVGSNEKRKTMASLSTAIFLIVVFGSLSYSVLVTRPRNTFLYSFSVTMNCSSSLGSASIVWYYSLFNTSNNETIAVGSKVNSNYTGWISIRQPNSNSSDLIITFGGSGQAGTYTCSDGTSMASAELIRQVSWYHWPQTLQPGSIFNGGTVCVNISSLYFANNYFNPILYIALKNSSIVHNFTKPVIEPFWLQKTQTMATVTVYTTVTCNMGNLLVYQVYTYFSEPTKTLPPYSATNAPDISSFVELKVTVDIICTIADVTTFISGLISENMAYYGSELVCESLSDYPVNYTWTDVTYGNTTNGQRLTVWHNGPYQCNASSEFNDTLYSASKTITNLTVIKFSFSASPKFGPIAGGTKIVISIAHWSEQSIDVGAVYLGNSLTASIASKDRKSGILTVVTPNVTEDLQKSLVITIEFTPGHFNITTDHYFQYRSNPKIFGLDPDNFISTGGTTVLVNGSDLSSVANPLIQLTVVVKRINSSEDFSNTTIDTCRVVTDDGTQMSCNMPPANLPTDFLVILDKSYSSNNSKTILRNSSTANALEVVGPNGIDRAVVYLGFILDGYTKYQNINEQLPNVKINFYSAPEINSSNKVFQYDPDGKELFQIKGKYLTRGCRLDDYSVQVGDNNCTNFDLTDNDLRCRLPDKKPQLTQNDTLYCEEFLNVRVYIGYKEYQYSCLNYVSNKTILIIGLCVGLGGFVLLVVTVIGVVCCCRKCRKEKADNNNRHTSPPSVSASNHQLHERRDNPEQIYQNFNETDDGL